MVTWQQFPTAVHVRRFHPSGLPFGDGFAVAAGGQVPTVTPDPGGGFVLTWSEVDADGLGAWAQCFDARGTARGSRFLVSPAAVDPARPAVSIFADPIHLVSAFEGNRSSESGSAILARAQRAAVCVTDGEDEPPTP